MPSAPGAGEGTGRSIELLALGLTFMTHDRLLVDLRLAPRSSSLQPPFGPLTKLAGRCAPGVPVSSICNWLNRNILAEKSEMSYDDSHYPC